MLKIQISQVEISASWVTMQCYYWSHCMVKGRQIWRILWRRMREWGRRWDIRWRARVASETCWNHTRGCWEINPNLGQRKLNFSSFGNCMNCYPKGMTLTQTTGWDRHTKKLGKFQKPPVMSQDMESEQQGKYQYMKSQMKSEGNFLRGCASSHAIGGIEKISCSCCRGNGGVRLDGEWRERETKDRRGLMIEIKSCGIFWKPLVDTWNLFNRFEGHSGLFQISYCDHTATKQLCVQSYPPSVTAFSQCSSPRIIMDFSGVSTIYNRDVHRKVKVGGQRSVSQR